MMRFLAPLCLLTTAATAEQPLAPRLEGVGELHYAITTAKPAAQEFFDQGLRLDYAFNHAEALRAFREAARLDPECAMCFWGQAWVLGPNINAPMSPEDRDLALEALDQAKQLTGDAKPVERDLIAALQKRYDPERPQGELNREYAEAMNALAERYPDDPEVQTLAVAAVMNTMPWRYWTKEGQPQPGIADAVARLERTIERWPDHAGAHHYYIHITEAVQPAKAIPSADKLGGLAPSAGHLVHMPSHIYIRVGRYEDAVDANQRAILADEDYIAQCQAQGMYPAGYYPHNIHFLWQAASFLGDSEMALDSARKTASRVSHHHAAAAFGQRFLATPYFAYVRFGRWAEMLTEPQPPEDQTFANAMWRYGRAVAFAARRQPERADAEVAELEKIVAEMPADAPPEELAEPLKAISELAATVAAGEAAASRQDFAEAERLLREAVQLEDDLPYTEPPYWHLPTRQNLGAVLLAAQKPEAAEEVFREELERNPENGWSLFGLVESLDVQGKREEASEARDRFTRAWRKADVKLSAARF